MSDVLCTFVHISDTHINSNPAYGAGNGRHAALPRAEAMVREINALPFPIDFVLHTGDVAFDPVESAYVTAREVLGRIRAPVHYLAGNHDDPAALQRVLLKRAEIQPELHETFDVNGVQIVMLDSNGPAELPAGLVSRAQLDWLTGLCNAADDQRPMVVAVHHNVLPIGAPWWDRYMRMTNGEALHRVLLGARHRLRGVFFGHVHQNVDILRDGILYSSCVSSWCQFHAWPGLEETVSDNVAQPGFCVVSVTREQTFTRRYSINA